LYDESNNTLDLITQIRRRPDMYFGGIDRRALHGLIDELLTNAVNQVLSGEGDQIEVILEDNNTVSVSDNGEGIPVYVYQDTGKTVLERLVTQIGAGQQCYQQLAIVNAVSKQMTIQIKRNGHVWEQSYKQGYPITELMRVRALQPNEQTGTFIRFNPDFTIFEPNTFSYGEISRKLRETSYLVPNTILMLDDRRSQPEGARVEFFS
jgi:DNA gyrase subunit B